MHKDMLHKMLLLIDNTLDHIFLITTRLNELQTVFTDEISVSLGMR